MKTRSLILVAIAFVSTFATYLSAATPDTITLSSSNDTLQGTIENYDRDKKIITFTSDKGKIPYPLTLVKTYTLAPRPELKEADASIESGNLDKAIETLKPLVDKYLGLNADWIAEAAADIAECYTRQRKAVEADTVLKQIKDMYPKSPLRLKGDLVQAKAFVDRNVPEEAIKLLDQVEKELPKTPTLSATYMSMYSELFFIRGAACEKANKPAEAYEAYLKTGIIYVQPEERSKEALAKAEQIKKANPSVHVN